MGDCVNRHVSKANARGGAWANLGQLASSQLIELGSGCILFINEGSRRFFGRCASIRAWFVFCLLVRLFMGTLTTRFVSPMPLIALSAFVSLYSPE